MEREYKRQQTIITHAQKGQNFIRPNANGYTEQQYADYAKYQGFIDRATARMEEMEETARSLQCGKCKHPQTSHAQFVNDAGCYHTAGCTCLAFA
jgi:hypothetical protein